MSTQHQLWVVCFTELPKKIQKDQQDPSISCQARSEETKRGQVQLPNPSRTSSSWTWNGLNCEIKWREYEMIWNVQTPMKVAFNTDAAFTSCLPLKQFRICALGSGHEGLQGLPCLMFATDCTSSPQNIDPFQGLWEDQNSFGMACKSCQLSTIANSIYRAQFYAICASLYRYRFQWHWTMIQVLFRPVQLKMFLCTNACVTYWSQGHTTIFFVSRVLPKSPHNMSALLHVLHYASLKW